MATIAAGNHVEVYVPLAGDITITPGTGGYVEFGCSSPSGESAPEGRRLYAAAAIAIPAGSTMFLRAEGEDATYTDPATGGGVVTSYTAAQLSALAAAGGLTPYATYVASDTGDVSDARSTSALSLRAVAYRPKFTGIGDSLTAMLHNIYTLSSATRLNGVVTLVTGSAHDQFAGGRIRLDGIDTFDPTLRGTYTVASRVDATTLTVACPGPDGALTMGTTPRITNLQRRSNQGPLAWMLILGNQPFEVAELFATSGRRTADMLQFVPAAAATGAGYCWVLGGTNDISLDSASASSVLANLRAIHAAVISAGMRPLVCTIPPFIGSAWTAAKAKTYNQVNQALRDDCRSDGRKILVDLYAAVVDPLSGSQGSGKTGYIVANDVHFTGRGAYYAGKRAWSDISAAIKAVDKRTTSNADNRGFDAASTNIVDTAPWTNSGGTVNAPVTGTIPSGFTASRGGSCAGVASAPARSDGYGYDATMVATPAVASDTATIQTNGGTWAARVVAGTQYEVLVSMSMSGLSGSTLSGMDARLACTIDGNAIYSGSGGLITFETTMPDEDWSGVLAFPLFGIAGAISAGELNCTMTFSGAGSAVTMKVGRVSMRPLIS